MQVKFIRDMNYIQIKQFSWTLHYQKTSRDYFVSQNQHRAQNKYASIQVAILDQHNEMTRNMSNKCQDNGNINDIKKEWAFNSINRKRRDELMK